MRIIHIIFASRFTEGFTYQDNLIPEYHAKDGHDVTIITTCYRWDEKADLFYTPPIDKKLDNGIRLIRRKYTTIINSFITKKIRKVRGLYPLIEQLLPDIIFFHGPQSIELLTAAKFIKNNIKTKLFVDNHADFNNSASNILSLIFLHKFFWSLIAKRAEPYVSKFYGVIPARVDFLINVYRISREKCELLVMGADDEKVISAKNNNKREKIRMTYGFTNEDFVIITGGKINSSKKQTLLLLQAMHTLDHKNVKLLLFGSISPDLKDAVFSKVDNTIVYYLGWINSDEIYDFFAASDLAIFPGSHSVLWEQAVGMGLPCIFKYWKGTTHVDVGGNCRFLYNDKVTEIKHVLDEVVSNETEFQEMKRVAEEEGVKVFSYKEISRRSIQI